MKINKLTLMDEHKEVVTFGNELANVCGSCVIEGTATCDGCRQGRETCRLFGMAVRIETANLMVKKEDSTYNDKQAESKGISQVVEIEWR